MPTFDSIVVGEDWISEHYFNTDSTKESFQSEVLKLRKQWDEQAKEGHDSVLKRFLGERGTFQVELAELLEEPSKASAVYHKVREALGFKGTTADLTAGRAGTRLQVPNVWKSHNGDVLFLESRPVESVEDLLDSAKGSSRMLAPAFIDDKEAELSAPKLISELYRTDEPPQFIVVFGGRWLLLTQRERWAEGRYLAADLLLACERKDTKRGGEVDRMLAIFGRDSLLPDASETIWWNQILENSVKHTIGVSKDLREGIRLSIEIIANDVLRRREALGLPLVEIDGQVLARQSLRYLYRILFLLYAEASPEMGVLPVGVGEYNEGYGLDRLRELALNVPESQRAMSGTHIYQSLGTLFRLVDNGHRPSLDPHTELNTLAHTPTPAEGDPGLHFDSLKADLFDPKAMADIDLVGLSNAALQKVLEHLLLSKELKGKDRGFISYAELGVNQLGAVYEGLMSYTGFIAETDLHEVAKDGDSSKGSWVVPVERSESIERKHFVTTRNEVSGDLEPVLHEKGTFVFRLAGRERQQSASYYTPEVLTRFVVSQALEELLDQDGKRTSADEILKLTVCEPALGSGAFAIEAVRQLADEYLKRKQAELDELIPADDYPVQLQKVKAQIALHQVYGVDLNSTAVELAEVSLWLDTMVAGLQAPWFGLHLRRGNSLIGARRATYSRAAVNDKSWLTSVPVHAPVSGLAEAMAAEKDDPNVVGRIHHFLLPAAGWGAAADAKEVKDLAADAQKELKAWRNRIKAKPSKAQLDRLIGLGRRAETLWQFTLRRFEVAEAEARRHIDFFGKGPSAGIAGTPVSRAEIEVKLNDPNGAYQRLRRVMDAWNALWFWPLTEPNGGGIRPPSLDEWITALESLLGIPAADHSAKAEKRIWANQTSILDVGTWHDLNTAEDLDLSFARAADVAVARQKHPWLEVCESVANGQGFFHWELDFASVFGHGGFDLQIGNPPWVRPDWDEASVFAENDPIWQLDSDVDQATYNSRRSSALDSESNAIMIVEEYATYFATRAILSSAAMYPVTSTIRLDLYRPFMEHAWISASPRGVVGFVHPESHFKDPKGGVVRRETYRRLRRHWHFKNELELFEISHARYYGVHIYGTLQSHVNFIMASSLYHPSTAERSFNHDGSGAVPGTKDLEGRWNLEPHASRLINVTDQTLTSWAAMIDEPGTPPGEARMLYPVNAASAAVLEKTATRPKLRDSGFYYSTGWNDTTDRKKGYFDYFRSRPASPSNAILQGSHVFVNNPFYKEFPEVGGFNSAVPELCLDDIAPDFVPRTGFKLLNSVAVSDSNFSRFGPRQKPAPEFYRMAWKRRLDPSTERTLQPCLISPGYKHVSTIGSLAFESNQKTVFAVGLLSGLVADHQVKVMGITDLWRSQLEVLPFVQDAHPLLVTAVVFRVMQLNCLSNAYDRLWDELYSDVWNRSEIQVGKRRSLNAVDNKNRSNSILTNSGERRIAAVELDVLGALILGVEIEELIAIYETQFNVLREYERADLFDVYGRKVPSEISKLYRQHGENLSHEECTVLNAAGSAITYKLPFVGFDREADMRQAHAHFTKLMEELN
jgi:hypothetical protein